jgi:hypothetical protein
MPSQPDRFFLGRPVELDGSESEGAAGTPLVDGSSSIPFVALWHAPSVGDLLAITAAGGRWVAERGGASSARICASVGCLPNDHPVVGAVVQLWSGSTLVDSCTTGTDGCCSFARAGTYTVKVYVSGTLEYSGSRTLAGGTISIGLSASSVQAVCCGGYLIPMVLHLTDGAGTLDFVFDPNYFYPLWTGGHSVTRQSCPVTTPDNVCVVGSPSDGPVRVCYQMICHAGQTPTFAIQRSWSWVYEQGTLNPIWYQDPSGFAPGQFCITAPPAVCGNPLTDTASLGTDPSSSDPFVLSGTPVPSAGNATADPIGGSIAISA